MTILSFYPLNLKIMKTNSGGNLLVVICLLVLSVNIFLLSTKDCDKSITEEDYNRLSYNMSQLETINNNQLKSNYNRHLLETQKEKEGFPSLFLPSFVFQTSSLSFAIRPALRNKVDQTEGYSAYFLYICRN